MEYKDYYIEQHLRQSDLNPLLLWDDEDLAASKLYSKDYNYSAKKYVEKGNKCVKEGKNYLEQQNVSEAIKKYEKAIDKYEKAIKLSPYYSIAYYNKRIAEKELDHYHKPNEKNELSAITNGTKNLTLPEGNTEIPEISCISTPIAAESEAAGTSKASLSTSFVVSVIAAVPEHECSSDEDVEFSSDEEKEFEREYKTYKENNTVFPYVIRKDVDNVAIEQHDEILVSNSSTYGVASKFLSKIEDKGFEYGEKSNLSNISVSIGLNRMLSLSTRKRKSLILELKTNIITAIKTARFGFYWTYHWHKGEKKVETDYVRKFYKYLKKKEPELAEKLLKLEEEFEKERSNIPYQYIREHAKNHDKTRELVMGQRKNSSYVYLHFVDADVFDFNGVYSAYMRIVEGCCKIPHVMSTGYEYPVDSEGQAYRLLSHMDRMYRVITSFHIPLGVYYPEPNMCILVPKNHDTVPESFIDSKRVWQGTMLESPNLLSAMNKNEKRNVYAIFSEDNPVFTDVPPRARVSADRWKTPLTFSAELNKGPASPLKEDIELYQKVSQSTSHVLRWCKNLNINQAIEYDKSFEGEPVYNAHGNEIEAIDKQCNSLISHIRFCKNVERPKSKLSKRIVGGDKIANDIVGAIKAMEKYEDVFKEKFERTKAEQKLIDVISRRGIDLGDISRKLLLMMATPPFLKLILGNIKIKGTDMIAVLNKSDLSIVALIKNAFHRGEIDNEDVVEILNIAMKHPECLSEACSEYRLLHVLERYRENPLHLKFMGMNPYDIVDILDRNDPHDEEIFRFAIGHQYVYDEDNIILYKDTNESADEEYLIDSTVKEYQIELHFKELFNKIKCMCQQTKDQ